MKLAIVGTGAMGKVLRQYAEEEGTFDTIFFIEPTEENTWPSEKPDLLIDFSNPGAINSIYNFCRKQGGGIAVVLATTGYGPQEWEIIKLIQKICPLVQKNNFSRGVEVMNRLAEQGAQLLGDTVDIRVLEAHHTKKRDAPSGTAKTLCSCLGIPEEEYPEKTAVLRMGTVPGEHTVYFAMEDEVLEITHRAFSKKIFAIGALTAGKELLGI